MGNMDTSPIKEWVKRELVPALTAIEKVEKSRDFEVWEQGLLSGMAMMSAQLQTQSAFTAEELFSAVLFVWLADKEILGVRND